MKKLFIISIVVLGALLLVSCNSRSGRLKEYNDMKAKAIEEYKAKEEAKNKEHNITIRFAGKGSEIPKDGELLVIKVSLEDTIIVAPATLDDSRRILENHGKG